MKNGTLEVALCLPTGDTVKTDFMLSIIHVLMAPRNGVLRYSLANKQSCYVDMNRNLLVEVALKNKKDAVLFVDSDMTVPADIGERLAAHDKEIIGADYGRRHHPYDRCGRTLDGLELGKTGLREMESLGGGALLIRTSVFERMKAPWFYNDYAGCVGGNGIIPVGEDRTFCRDARAAGFQIWCDQDTTRLVSHYGGLHIRIE